MDEERVKALYCSNPIAQTFFDLMAGRSRNQTETKVDRIVTLLSGDRPSVSKADIVQLFRSLEDAGCGQFVVGRRGWQSRFVWSAGSLGVARVATGERKTAAAEEAEEGDIDVEMFEHTYLLRTDLKIAIELPVDLTTTEAERLAGFVRTLPIED